MRGFGGAAVPENVRWRNGEWRQSEPRYNAGMETPERPPVMEYATPRQRRGGRWWYAGAWALAAIGLPPAIWMWSLQGGLHDAPPTPAEMQRYLTGFAIMLAAPIGGIACGAMAVWVCRSKVERSAALALMVFHGLCIYAYVRMMLAFWP
jgi:hypothetical protein